MSHPTAAPVPAPAGSEHPQAALPVARCGDCLYWRDEEIPGLSGGTGTCRAGRPGSFRYVTDDGKKGVANFPIALSESWCREFIHRVLGPQYADGPLRHGTIMQSVVRRKQWRYPTEPEA